MPTPKLLIFLAVWKRPEITEICFMGINRLKKSGLFPIEAFAVISEESMIPLCEKYGVDYVMHENLPLGKKKNFGLTEAYKRKEFDYLVEIGSDDLLKNDWLTAFKPFFDLRKNLITLSNFVYLNSEDGTCRRMTTASTYGLGRAIHRGVFDKYGTNLWQDRLNKGLDNNSIFFMARHGILENRVRTEKPIAIDIKSDVNIWQFNYLHGKPYTLEETLEGLSEEEITAINALINVTV